MGLINFQLNLNIQWHLFNLNFELPQNIELIYLNLNLVYNIIYICAMFPIFNEIWS